MNMDDTFQDRILICSDCHGEFVFTAGEQLFFFDKQFKNDPKRCKPCKSRRSGLASAATGSGPAAAGLSRTETRTECSECGIQTTVPFKPTQGRPVLCRACFQQKNRAARPTEIAAANAVAEPLSAGATLEALDALAPDSLSSELPADAAVLAAASMASASEGSSVASSADLASIVKDSPVEDSPDPAASTEIPAALLAADEASRAGLNLDGAVAERADA